MRMKDIARLAGVAESTVSRAINGKPGVGEETRKRILELVEKYNFKPNRLAQGLANKGTRTLGLMIPDITDNMFTQMVAGVEEYATKKGFRVVLAVTRGEREKEKEFIDFFKQKDVDGVIVLGRGLARYKALELFFARKPVILVNQFCEDLALPSLIIDYNQAAVLAINYFRAGGYKNFGLILNGADLDDEQLIEGFQKELRPEEHETGNIVKTLDYSREAGYQAFLDIINMPDAPRALIVFGDRLAMGVLEAIREGGFFLPVDFEMLVIGDNPLFELVNPPLTVVSPNFCDMGRHACSFLLQKLEDNNETEEFINVIQPILTIRKSTSLQKFEKSL